MGIDGVPYSKIKHKNTKFTIRARNYSVKQNPCSYCELSVLVFTPFLLHGN